MAWIWFAPLGYWSWPRLSRKQNMFYCSYCGCQLDEGGKCPGCGFDCYKEYYHPEAPLYTCHHCQNKIVKIGNFCPFCGEKIN